MLFQMPPGGPGNANADSCLCHKGICSTKSELDQLTSFKTLPRIYLMEISALELHIAIASVRQVIAILTGKRPPRASPNEIQKYQI